MNLSIYPLQIIITLLLISYSLSQPLTTNLTTTPTTPTLTTTAQCKHPQGDWFYEHGWSFNYNGDECTCVNREIQCGPNAQPLAPVQCAPSGCTCRDFYNNFDAESGWDLDYQKLGLKCTCLKGLWKCQGIDGGVNRCIHGTQVYDSGTIVQVDSLSCTCQDGTIVCPELVTPIVPITPTVPISPLPDVTVPTTNVTVLPTTTANVTLPPTVPPTNITVPMVPSVPVILTPTTPSVAVPTTISPTNITVPTVPSVPVIQAPQAPAVAVPPTISPTNITVPPTTLPSSCSTIYQTLNERQVEFSSLVAAIDATNLQTALDNPQSQVTLFAPINAAFDDVLLMLQVDLGRLLMDEFLVPVIQYHIVESLVNATQVVGSALFTTLQGQQLAVLGGEEIGFQVQGTRGAQVNVIEANVVACAGIVHVIDGVLIPILG